MLFMDQSLLGVYRHYSGKTYQVTGLARHHETVEEWVLYKPLYAIPEFGEDVIFIRPKTEFFGMVEYNGITQQRFSKI